MTLIYRYSDEANAVLRQELVDLATQRGIVMRLLPGKRASDSSWLPAGSGEDVAELVRLAPNITSSDVFICGPRGWADAVHRAASSAGVRQRDIHREKVSW